MDVDLGSSAFKRNARSILAEWARRPPFYVLSSGPRQVVCGRYADHRDIHRHPKRIMAFGAGPHHCIGNILGRTAITIAMRRMLARFPQARLADPGFVPSYGGAVGELRLQHLPMTIQ